MWASDQAVLLSESVGSSRYQLACSAWIVCYGGDPGELPIALQNGGLRSRKDIEQWSHSSDEIMMVNAVRWLHSSKEVFTDPNVLLVYIPAHREVIAEFIAKALASAWNCSREEVGIRNSYDWVRVGLYEDRSPAMDWDVTIFRLKQSAGSIF